MNGVDEVAAVVSGHRALATAGLADLIWGHLAVRDAGGRGVWSKAAGWGFEEVTPERVILVSNENTVLAGEGSPHLECLIHTSVMARRPDAAVTIHTHSEAAIAFASLEVPLRPLSHDAIPFLDPDIPRFGMSDLISTPERGAALASALGDAAGCLIPGHGAVVVGEDLAHAVMHAVLLERACRIQLSAMSAGGPRTWSDDAEVASKRAGLWSDRQIHAGFDYLVRGVDRRDRPVSE